MSEQKKNVEIEEAIREKLTGDAQKNALDFFSSMREHEITCEYFDIGNYTGWYPTYKDKGFGCILINPYRDNTDKKIGIYIGLELDLSNLIPLDDEMKENILAHVRICPTQRCSPPYCNVENSGHECKNRWKIFGIEYESTCHSPLEFIDPDVKTYENIKKLLLMADMQRL